ncbi:MAG: hypothetical protein CL886_10345 [Dehalococcoidia bacterium]|nr:hypothetical protein [Dehalococcoidia bacterium]
MKKILTLFLLLLTGWLAFVHFSEPLINRVINKERESIKVAMQDLLDLEIQFDAVQINYIIDNYINLRPSLVFDQISLKQGQEDLTPLLVKQFTLEVNLWKTLIDQTISFSSIVVDGSNLDFSHQEENGFLLNNIPIKQLFVFRKPGGKRPSLEIKNISSRAVDIERIQTKIGLANIIDSSNVNFKTSYAWDEIPRKSDITSGNGVVSINVKDGQINSDERIPGKVLSLFSFSELPKRLVLDFRDVFGEGFPFDRLEADVTFTDNIAYTCNLSISSTTADVIILGATDISKRTYNQMVIVQPLVSDLLPGGAAIVAGPAAAASMFLLTKILRRPLKDAGVAYYSVNGSWDNPEIKQLTENEIDFSLIENCNKFLPDVDQEIQSLTK